MTGKIFLSYAREDRQTVRQIYTELKDAGHDPWMDVENILPGENWRRAINRAIEDAGIFLAVLSCNSVNKRGVIQKEIRLALDKMDELLPGDLFIIPLRIDDCDIPERLGHLQVLDWDDGAGLDRLLAAIETGLARREAEVTADSAPASVPSLAARQEDPQQTARERFANFVKKNGGLLVLIASIATILAAMLQFVDSPAIQAFFRSPTPTSTFTATGTIIPTSTYTPSSTPTDTPSPSPDFSATASMTTQPSRTPTVGVTPSFTPTHAVTLPAITSADCVPKEARRWEAYVIEAIDADKIKVRIQGDIALIHYLGVEAPDKEAYFGIYSFYKNIEWVVDQWVTLVSDPELEESGDELLRYVFVDDLFVNYELIRQGFAYEQGDASSYACADSFEHAQRQAELSPAGLWKPTNTPWPSPAPGEPPCSCRGDTRNCDTFRTQGEAQDCFEYCQGLGYGDVHNLDTDGDNWACEN